jgi:hypothetical protein
MLEHQLDYSAPGPDPDTLGMDRRCFVKLSALFAGGVAAFGGLLGVATKKTPWPSQASPKGMAPP